MTVLLLCAGPGSADNGGTAEDAAPPQVSANELLHRAYENLYADDYVQELELSTSEDGGQSMRRRLQITRKQSTLPGKALLRFLEPASVRRTSVLVLENETGSDDLFVYLPATDFTRRISGAQRADAFFGTDLSYEDVEPKRASDWLASYVDSERSEDDACWVIEIRARPEFESTYDRMRSCIEPERAVIHWTEFYAGGRPMKRLEVDPGSVRSVGPRFIPFSARMTTPDRRSETELLVGAHDLRQDIPDSLFSKKSLELGDAKRDRKRSGKPLEP